METIKSFKDHQILDYFDYPIVEDYGTLSFGQLGRSASPTDVSTGIDEAPKFRDESFDGWPKLTALELIGKDHGTLSFGPHGRSASPTDVSTGISKAPKSRVAAFNYREKRQRAANAMTIVISKINNGSQISDDQLEDFAAALDLIIGPNDPCFGEIEGVPHVQGQPKIPPGVRFDPYGPSDYPDAPGFEPGRFDRGGAGSGRPHPDLPHFGGNDGYIWRY